MDWQLIQSPRWEIVAGEGNKIENRNNFVAAILNTIQRKYNAGGGRGRIFNISVQSFLCFLLVCTAH